MSPGSTMPVHHVRCLECHKALALKTYWRQPCCKPCRKRRARAKEATSLFELRQQARRYRILLDASGYSFEELLASVSFRRPRTRSARFDLALEKRAQA